MLHASCGSYARTSCPAAISSPAMPRRKWALPWFQSESSEWQKRTTRMSGLLRRLRPVHDRLPVVVGQQADGLAVAAHRADIDIRAPRLDAARDAAGFEPGIDERADILVRLPPLDPQRVQLPEDRPAHPEGAPHPVRRRAGDLDLNLANLVARP